MDFVINPWFFYIINTVDDMRNFFFVIFIISLFIYVVSVGLFMFNYVPGVDDDNEDKICKNFARKSRLIMIIMIVLIFLTPTKTALYQMLISSYATQDNMESVVDYIIESVDKIAEYEK